ncbi:MAG: T9SS type A sorting domain-containing protein [Candidatus Kapabacteria bacterium]|nr:T9SS type A sorting domain-containing protein [Candidatus Kapabacteria bacterium]
MKKINLIILLLLSILTNNVRLISQNPLGQFAPKQLDVYKDKILILGYDWEKNGLLSIFTKNVNDTSLSITNITQDINLELNVQSKVRFDNFGNIWAFGKSNLWKYENGGWIDVQTPPDLLPNRQFRDFCFDNENNLYVSVMIGFERYRETVNGTVYVVYDSVNNELLKINTKTPTVSYDVIKKFNHKLEHEFDAIHAITKRPDGAISCILAEVTNNLMIYNNGALSYETIPVSPDGLLAKVTSMVYDTDKNLLYSVKCAGQFFNLAPSNGVHKITVNGTHFYWDSSDGLKGELFNDRRFEPTLSVHDISINKKTGLIWGVTDFGVFSIDETKPKQNQLTFYSRDSLVNQKFRYFPSKVSGSGSGFEFVTLVHHENKSFFASQLGFLEITGNETPSSVANNDISLTNSIDILPLPSSKSEVFISINNHEFVNGSTLSIVDMSGRTLQRIQIESATGNIQIPVNTKDLSSGTYYAVLRSGRNTISKQFIVVN